MLSRRTAVGLTLETLIDDDATCAIAGDCSAFLLASPVARRLQQFSGNALPARVGPDVKPFDIPGSLSFEPGHVSPDGKLDETYNHAGNILGHHGR